MSTLPTLHDIYTRGCRNNAKQIMKDPTPHNKFRLLRSGRLLCSLKAQTERLRRSFLPHAVRILNSNKWVTHCPLNSKNKTVMLLINVDTIKLTITTGIETQVVNYFFDTARSQINSKPELSSLPSCYPACTLCIWGYKQQRCSLCYMIDIFVTGLDLIGSRVLGLWIQFSLLSFSVACWSVFNVITVSVLKIEKAQIIHRQHFDFIYFFAL